MVTTFLFRHRDRLVGAWGAGSVLALWPPRGWTPSIAAVLAGLTLRLWARRHIGPHSRGRILSNTERCTGGPYRFLDHPLYAANLLVVAGLATLLAGPAPKALPAVLGPAILYAWLAREESRALREARAPERSHPLPRGDRGMRSEWASVLPPLALWSLLLWAALG